MENRDYYKLKESALTFFWMKRAAGHEWAKTIVDGFKENN